MAHDPLLINVTTSHSRFLHDYVEREENMMFEQIVDNIDEDADSEYLDMFGDFVDLNVPPIGLSVSSRFTAFMCSKEMEYYSEVFCDKYFDSLRFSENPEDIVNMNRVDAWNIDWAYGLMFQAFIATEYNLELPCLEKRNRKVPIMCQKLKRSYKSKLYLDKDPIYDELLLNCKLSENHTYKRKSPRDQILLHIFILDLLLHPYYRFCITWHNKKNFSFEIINSKVVAHIWMTIKGNDTCNYENFARGIRYKRRNSNMFTRTDQSSRCVYQLTKFAILDYKIKRSKNDLAAELLSEALL